MEFPGLLSLHLIIGALVAWSIALAATLWWRRSEGHRDLLKDLLAVTGVLALTAGFFWRLIFSDGVWVPAGGGDFASFYYPLYTFGSQVIASGNIPLWNPFLYSGMPFAADVQTAVFYPINLAIFAFSGGFNYQQIELAAVFHYFLAAAGLYALAVTLGSSRIAGVVGGVLFAFSGFMVAHLGHFPMMVTASWLAILILFAHLTFTRRSYLWAVASGLVLAIVILAGHAQVSLYIASTVAVYWLYLTLKGMPQKHGSLRVHAGYWSQSVSLIAILVVIGVAGSAVQLLPSWELSQLSVRSAISYEESTGFSASPMTLATLFLPHLFGDNPTNYWGDWMSTEVFGYIGLFSLILAVVGVLHRRDRAPFFALLALGGLLLSFGGHTILYDWVYQFVPGFGKMRASGRFMLLFDFGIAVLAAFGTDGILRLAQSRTDAPVQLKKTIRYAGIGAGIGAAIILALFLPIFYSQLLSNIDVLPHLVTAIQGLTMAAIFLAASAGLLLAVSAGWFSRRAASALIVAVIVVDLFSAWTAFNVTTTDPTAGFRQEQAVSLIQKDKGIFRIDSETGALDEWQPSIGAVAGLQDVSGLYNPLRLARYNAVWEIAKQDRLSKLYDFLNVKYVIAPMSVRMDPSQYEGIYQNSDKYKVYLHHGTLPRAYIVHNSATGLSDEEILKRLGNSAFNPAKKVLLEDHEAPALKQDNPTGDAVVQEYSNERLSINAKTDTPGYLVMSEVWYPGWKAELDGKPVELLRANYAFRAVYLEPGDHQIVMTYDPWTWKAGIVVSSITWAAAGGFFLLFAARRFYPRSTADREAARIFH